MKLKPILFTLFSVLILQACSSSNDSPRGGNAPPLTNPGGGPVTGVIEAIFNPASGDPTQVPIPTNLFLSGTTDLTLNIPVADPTDFSDPLVALNGLDGFSTVAPWSTNFSVDVAPASVNPSTVKMYEVTLTGPGGGVDLSAEEPVVNELVFGVDYFATSTGSGIAILPLKPLKQLTSYMAVITNGIQDANGNIATPSQTYFLAKRDEPLAINGVSTDPLLDDATASALEPLRQLTFTQEAAAASQGVDPDSIVLSWTATTQSISPVLAAAKSISTAGASTLAPTGLSTAAVGGAGIADIYIGTMSSPYYLTAPSAENPIAPLNQFWQAAPGAYNPPFDAFGLDPTSTNLTFANPVPVATSIQNLPVLMTVPNAGSGQTKPAAGWPIMIYQHGITRNRTDMLAVADTMASIGFAVVAIDLAMHGITDTANPFYIGNTPFGDAGIMERTFNVDYINNETGAPGPDGLIDSSGAHFINLANLLVSRDNTRQGIADLFTLTETIPLMDIDGDGAGDFNEANITFTGQSLGAITGTGFLAFAPNVQSAVLSAPGGGIANLLIGSPTFGPRIIGGLAANGVEQGTTAFNLFVLATQTAVDSADPVNLAGLAAAQNNILVHQINGDMVVTNTVPGAPLSGTEPLIAALGLTSYSESFADPAGLDAAVRFTEGDHGSLLSPAASAAATIEMQSQMAAFQATSGTVLNITNTDVVQ